MRLHINKDTKVKDAVDTFNDNLKVKPKDSTLTISISEKVSLINIGQIIADILKEADITVLNLIDLNMTYQTILALKQTLINETTLKELNISNNNIGNEGIKAIGKILENNKTIKKLYVDVNNIGNDGLNFLMNSLAKNDTLEVYSISGNNITQINNFAAGKVTHAYLNDNDINSLGSATDSIKSSKGLKWLDLSANKISVNQEFVDTFKDISFNIDVRDNLLEDGITLTGANIITGNE